MELGLRLAVLISTVEFMNECCGRDRIAKLEKDLSLLLGVLLSLITIKCMHRGIMRAERTEQETSRRGKGRVFSLH